MDLTATRPPEKVVCCPPPSSNNDRPRPPPPPSPPPSGVSRKAMSTPPPPPPPQCPPPALPEVLLDPAADLEPKNEEVSVNKLVECPTKDGADEIDSLAKDSCTDCNHNQQELKEDIAVKASHGNSKESLSADLNVHIPDNDTGIKCPHDSDSGPAGSTSRSGSASSTNMVYEQNKMEDVVATGKISETSVKQITRQSSSASPPTVLPKPSRTSVRPSQPPPPRPMEATPPPPLFQAPIPEFNHTSQELDESFPPPPPLLANDMTSESVIVNDTIPAEFPAPPCVDDLPVAPSDNIVTENRIAGTDVNRMSAASSVSSSLDSSVFSNATTASVHSNIEAARLRKPTLSPPWMQTPSVPSATEPKEPSEIIGHRVSVRETSSKLEGVLNIQNLAGRMSLVDKPTSPLSVPIQEGGTSDLGSEISEKDPLTPDSVFSPSFANSNVKSFAPSDTASNIDEGSEPENSNHDDHETVPVTLGNIKNLNRRETCLPSRNKSTDSDDNKRVKFSMKSESESLPNIRCVQEVDEETMRTGLSKDDIVQAKAFYQGNKSEVRVCKCLATLYWADYAAEIPVDQWKPTHVGIPIFVINYGEGRRPKGITFTFAEKGTGFLLWNNRLNWDSNYRSIERSFHQFRNSAEPNKAVGIAFQDEEAADDFKQYLELITADKDTNLLGDPTIKLKKPKSRLSIKKIRSMLPKKTDISQPCQFTHVTQLKRSTDNSEILALTMVPFSE